MDKDTIVEAVTSKVNTRLTQRELSHPPDFLYEWIVSSILENNKIIENNVETNYDQSERLAAVMMQWVMDNKGNPVNIDSNVTSQILQQLGQEGWTIIPPQ